MKGKFCGKCEYLEIDEDLQNYIFKKVFQKPDHVCLKYKEKLQHKFDHPKINRCDICLEENEI